MQTISSKKRMQKLALKWRKEGKKIVFVPTMGFLHEGHLSLMRWGKKRADALVISIFVNPLQFGPHEDYKRYPRAKQRDLRLAKEVGVDVVFYPSVKQMYPDGFCTSVSVKGKLTSVLCAPFRPGHFDGVATVVLKLFQIVQPDIAVFGQKDLQQFRVIEKMCIDLDFPVKLIMRPIVRDPDGLAMSSRNEYLSQEQRQRALSLYQAIELARSLFRSGEKKSSVLRKKLMRYLAQNVKVDYIEFVDMKTLDSCKIVDASTVVAIAARVDDIRLIDNGSLGGEHVA